MSAFIVSAMPSLCPTDLIICGFVLVLFDWCIGRTIGGPVADQSLPHRAYSAVYTRSVELKIETGKD